MFLGALTSRTASISLVTTVRADNRIITDGFGTGDLYYNYSHL